MIVGNVDRAGAAQPQAAARVLEHRARRAICSSRSRPARAAAASALLFYLFAYTLATFGAFAVIVALGSAGEDDGDDRRATPGSGPCGRGWRSAMAVFMLALLGFPIFGGIGFFAKWYVLQAALQAPVAADAARRRSRAHDRRVARATTCTS